MSESPAPTPYTPTPTAPNSSCFIDPNKTILSLATASKFFFLKSGDFANYVNSNLYQLGGSQILMSALTSVTAGTASASKALVLDGSSNITGVNNFTFTGSLSGSIINSSSYLLAGSGITMSALTGITLGAVTANKALTVDASSNITGSVTISRNGSHLAFVNGANSSLIEHSASPNMLRLVGPGSYCMNISSTGCFLGSSSRDPLAPLDMGQVASNKIISLFNETTSYYGFSANNTATQYSAGTNAEHVFYNNCTNASPINTKRMTISSGGNVQATSFSATGFTTAGLDQNSLKGHYSAARTEGQLFTYSYPSGGYLYTSIGGNGNISTNKDNGFVNINTISQSFAAPLSVFGSGSFTRAAQFGFLRSTAPAADTATGFTGRSFSIYSDNGIIVQNGEINCFCDERKKKEIKPLNLAMVDKFINMMNPIEFKYKKGDQNIKYGYSAQDLVKYNLNDLVGITDVYAEDGDEPLEAEEIVTDNGEVFSLPSDVSLSVNLLSIIPILHLYIKKQDKKINHNNKLIHELNSKIIELKEFINNSY